MGEGITETGNDEVEMRGLGRDEVGVITVEVRKAKKEGIEEEGNLVKKEVLRKEVGILTKR